ncbi:hypothetical protein [Sphingobium fuliginis]|jgi:hypothetical protein|uniref:hypothetical protein n=1 Tax=Sphingobium fuliginis (strain ATCC 27551) TaxID=336203 RepID=UPI0037C83F3D
MFISKKKHEAALALMAKANVDQESRIAIENERGNHYRDLYLEAQAKLDALRSDAEKHRRSRANLKQFRDKGVA